MNKLNSYPVWNGLIYGSYDFIVCRLKKIENSNRYYWLTLYDIERRLNHLCEKAPPWLIASYKRTCPFLFQNKGKYVILKFSSNEIEESDYDEEPEVDISDKEEFFFESLDDTITYLNKNEIGLDWFTPPHTQKFPLHFTTWGKNG